MQLEPWMLIIGAVSTVLVPLLVARAASRSSESVNQATQITTREKNAVDGFSMLTKSLEDRVLKLESRVGQLEEQLSESRHLFRVAVAYIERLLDYISEQLPTAAHRPPIPPDLRPHIDDDGGPTDAVPAGSG